MHTDPTPSPDDAAFRPFGHAQTRRALHAAEVASAQTPAGPDPAAPVSTLVADSPAQDVTAPATDPAAPDPTAPTWGATPASAEVTPPTWGAEAPAPGLAPVAWDATQPFAPPAPPPVTEEPAPADTTSAKERVAAAFADAAADPEVAEPPPVAPVVAASAETPAPATPVEAPAPAAPAETLAASEPVEAEPAVPFIPPALPDSWRPPARDAAPREPRRTRLRSPKPDPEAEAPPAPPAAPTWTPAGVVEDDEASGRPPWFPFAVGGAVAVVVLLLLVVLLGGGGGSDGEPHIAEVAIADGPADPADRPPPTTEAPPTTAAVDDGPDTDAPLPGLADAPAGVAREDMAEALARTASAELVECVVTSVYTQIPQETIDQFAAADAPGDLTAAELDLWNATWAGCRQIVNG